MPPSLSSHRSNQINCTWICISAELSILPFTDDRCTNELAASADQLFPPSDAEMCATPDSPCVIGSLNTSQGIVVLVPVSWSVIDLRYHVCVCSPRGGDIIRIAPGNDRVALRTWEMTRDELGRKISPEFQ